MDRGTEINVYICIHYIYIYFHLLILLTSPPFFVPPPYLDYSLVDDSVAGEDEMLMEGNVVTEAETAFPMDLLVGVALKQELGAGGGDSAYTRQSNRDHRGGGELAVATTIRTTMTVSAVAVATMTMTADDPVGGVVTTG